MKFCLISDLHIDLNPWNWTVLEEATHQTDTLVVAGDISNDIWEVSHWLKQAKDRFANVLWVPGNHDFYNLGLHQTRLHDPAHEELWPYPVDMHSMLDHYERWSQHHGLHFLHRKSVTINGVRFVGATGWHDYRAGKPYTTESQIDAWYRYLNDTRITWDRNLVHPDHLQPFEAGVKDWKFMHHAVADASQPMVIVTHHVPHRLCLYQRPHDPIWTMMHGSFANLRMEEVKAEHLRYWVYGHTHQRGMRTIGTTEYVCNARGYSRENPNWEPLMLEV